MLQRILNLDLPSQQSLFLWGPRKSGKSTFLKQKYPNSLWIDLLQNDVCMQYAKRPSTLREEILAINDIQKFPVIIDEIQKVPALLDEIHWLLENKSPSSFIMCGSSLRRLKHDGANLLGGRAWRQVFSSLCYPELPEFDLLRIFNQGLLPSHYLCNTERLSHYLYNNASHQNFAYLAQKDNNQDTPALSSNHVDRSLNAYIFDYLVPEVQWESKIRNLGAFTRFLEAIAFSNGQLINVSNIARESGVSVKTVQAYLELLMDMLLGYVIMPYTKTTSRQIIVGHPKFYFFDTAIVRILKHLPKFTQLKGDEIGHAFEHYVFLEIMAFKAINRIDFEIKFWRSKSGLEVDFILTKTKIAIDGKKHKTTKEKIAIEEETNRLPIESKLAIECKITSNLEKRDMRGLIEFHKDHQPERSLIVCIAEKKRLITLDKLNIEVYPIQDFLRDLWSNQII